MCCIPHKNTNPDMTKEELDLVAEELREVRRRARARFVALLPEDALTVPTYALTRREISAVWVGEDGIVAPVSPVTPSVLRQVEEIVREANELVEIERVAVPV